MLCCAVLDVASIVILVLGVLSPLTTYHCYFIVASRFRMVTKLRRQLKNQQKKRSHRKNVEKRREARLEKELAEKRASKNIELDENDEPILPRSSKTGDQEVQEQVQKLVGGLNVQNQKRSAKKLSRKQAKRKEKQIEKGMATTAMISQKWEHKKQRVKARAQIRNDQEL